MLMYRLSRAGKLLWIEKASKAEPYWFYMDKGGNRCRVLFAVERTFDKLSAASAICLTAGTWKVTVGF